MRKIAIVNYKSRQGVLGEFPTFCMWKGAQRCSLSLFDQIKIVHADLSDFQGSWINRVKEM